MHQNPPRLVDGESVQRLAVCRRFPSCFALGHIDKFSVARNLKLGAESKPWNAYMGATRNLRKDLTYAPNCMLIVVVIVVVVTVVVVVIVIPRNS